MKKHFIKSKKSSFKFVVLLGLVSLFADITYEGARSITGPFLAILGASATVVGIVVGLGELIGYGLRLLSGYISDKTGRYWVITVVGYAINLFAVPLLSIAGRWEIAAMLIITERIGKAIRAPARDAMLSHATHSIGQGWGFALHEAMDQIGALIGPLVIAAVFYLKGSYNTGFAILLIPAILSMAILLTAKFIYPNPESFEEKKIKLEGKCFTKAFWIYLIAIALVAAGYADFPLIAYHLKKLALTSDNLIPIFYTIAMGVDAIAALLFGRLFDKIGITTLAISAFISSFFAIFAFGNNFYLAILGIILWGIGMGAQESVMRSSIAVLVPIDKRGFAYGIFNTGYGLAWFLGSAFMGILYDFSVVYLIIFSVIIQLTSIPMFILIKK